MKKFVQMAIVLLVIMPGAGCAYYGKHSERLVGAEADYRHYTTDINTPDDETAVSKDADCEYYVDELINSHDESVVINEETQLSDFDFQPFLRKVWIADEWSENYVRLPSFRLDEIADGVIVGELGSSSLSYPYIFHNLEHFSLPKNNMILTVHGNTAIGYSVTESEDIYSVYLELLDSDLIKATVEYSSVNVAPEHQQYDGTLIFRPLHISDVIGFVKCEDLSFDVNLNSWGDVRVVVGNIEYGPSRRVPWAALFLTDLNGNVLYNFGRPWTNGIRIIDVTVDDLNNDGLLDVFVSVGEAPMYIFDWHFYQLENGWFNSTRGDAIESGILFIAPVTTE